jgi:hypothetical protein
VRYQTYEVLKEEVANPRLRWAYLPYSMHMAGPREAIQHIIIRKNYGAPRPPPARRRGAWQRGACAALPAHAGACKSTPPDEAAPEAPAFWVPLLVKRPRQLRCWPAIVLQAAPCSVLEPPK